MKIDLIGVVLYIISVVLTLIVVFFDRKRFPGFYDKNSRYYGETSSELYWMSLIPVINIVIFFVLLFVIIEDLIYKRYT